MSEARARQLQESGTQVLLLLQGLTRAVVLYEPNNQTVTRLIDLLERALGDGLAHMPELRLQLRTEEFFANGKLLKLDPTNYERFSDLGVTLARFDAGEIRFEKGVTRTDIEAFVDDLAKAQRAAEAKLQSSYGKIHLATFKGRSMASFRMEPDKLAVWLYSGLLDIVDRLYTAHGDGEAPSLLPVRRILQLIIDNMRRHGAIYQLLTNVRDHGKAVDYVRLRVGICIDTLGLGIWLGLDNAQLMILGLAALTAGLSEEGDPEARLRPLFRYAGLAETAMPLVITVHDAAAARQGQPAGTPGRLLAVVETFHEAVSRPPPDTKLRPEAIVIADLVAGKIPNVHAGVARIFATYKGRHPLGAPVRLSDGRLAIVYSHGVSEEGKQRPQVGVVEDGRITERIDLADSELKIASIPHPHELPLVLKGATESAMLNAPDTPQAIPAHERPELFIEFEDEDEEDDDTEDTEDDPTEDGPLGDVGVDLRQGAAEGAGGEDEHGDDPPANPDDDSQVDEPTPGLGKQADQDDQPDDPDEQAPAHDDALPGGAEEPHAEEGSEE